LGFFLGGRIAIPARRKTQVGLIEQNPLAVPSLKQLLRRMFIPVHFDGGLLTGPHSSNRQIAAFIVDIGTLVMPLHTCIRQIRDRFPNAKILLIGHKLSHHQAVFLVRQGVGGFIRYAEVKELAQAISTVLDGRLKFPREAMEEFATGEKAARGRKESITKGESRILGFLEHGLSNKQAATVLGVSENTIKFHLSNIFRKLQVHDRHSAVIVSISSRLGAGIEGPMMQPGRRRPPGQTRTELRRSRSQSA
jgi:DNA-binding NarL/FixJ family response regulator